MPLKTQKEEQLLAASKRMDEIFINHDTSPIDELTAPNVVMHADNITLGEDVRGQSALKDYCASYFKKYNYKHTPIAGGVDENENVAFSFSVDEDVTPKEGNFPEVPGEKRAPARTHAIYKYEFNGEGKISDIWFLRQLSPDEAHRKMRNPPDFGAVQLDPHQYQSSGMEPSEDRARAMQEATNTFNGIWSSGDPAPADGIMTPDVRQVDLLLGREVRGVDDFKSMIKKVFQGWECKSNKQSTAVSAGNKAFVHWTFTGVEKSSGQQTTVYGLNMIVFTEDAKIAEVIGFRQPMLGERKELMKEE